MYDKFVAGLIATAVLAGCEREPALEKDTQSWPERAGWTQSLFTGAETHPFSSPAPGVCQSRPSTAAPCVNVMSTGISASVSRSRSACSAGVMMPFVSVRSLAPS